jgi:hypothetical protein
MPYTNICFIELVITLIYTRFKAYLIKNFIKEKIYVTTF